MLSMAPSEFVVISDYDNLWWPHWEQHWYHVNSWVFSITIFVCVLEAVTSSLLWLDSCLISWKVGATFLVRLMLPWSVLLKLISNTNCSGISLDFPHLFKIISEDLHIYLIICLLVDNICCMSVFKITCDSWCKCMLRSFWLSVTHSQCPVGFNMIS